MPLSRPRLRGSNLGHPQQWAQKLTLHLAVAAWWWSAIYPRLRFGLVCAEGVEVAGGADVERVVGDAGRGGDALAEGRILGDDFRLVDAGFEDRDGAVVE